MQSAAFVSQLLQHPGRDQLRYFADADLSAGVPHFARSPLQRYPTVHAEEMRHDHVDYLEDQLFVQLRAIPRSFRRVPRFEARGPQITILRFDLYIIHLGPCVYDPLDIGVQRRDILLRVSPPPSDETSPLGRRDSQSVHQREEAATLAYASNITHVFRVLALGGVASPIFATVEFVGTAGQQEKPAFVGTTRGDHRNPWGELVRVIPYDPVYAGENRIRGWNNRADL